MSTRKSTTTASRARTKATPKPEAETAAAPEAAPEQPPVVLTGRLCADPELRHTLTTGRPVTSFRLAVNDAEQATFHTIVVWGRQAEVVCEYLRKGRLIEVTGRSQERSYQTEDGERRVTEIVARNVQFLSRRASSEAQAESERAAA